MTSRPLFVGSGSTIGTPIIDTIPPQELVDALKRLGDRQALEPTKDEIPDSVAKNCNLEFCFDGGGAPIVVGAHCYLGTDFPARINGWQIYLDVTGSVSFTVKGGLYADFPALVSIVAAAGPAVTTARKNTGNVTDVATWDTEIPRGAVYEAIVDSISGGIEVMTLSLQAKRLDI